MRYRSLPPLEQELSVLVLGTLRLREHDMSTVDELLSAWLDAGGNVLDCAHEYGEGSSERAVGRWLEGMGCRDQVALVTKGCHPYGDGPRLTADDLAADLAESTARLRTEHIDLYLLHRDDVAAPVGPLLHALEDHRHAGRISACGASNWTVERLGEAESYATAHQLSGFSVSSPHLALADPTRPPYPGAVSACDATSRRWYRDHDLSVLAWSAQAGGFFVDAPPLTAAALYDDPGNVERRRRAQALAARKGCRAHTIALAWTLQQPFPTFAVIGPRSAAELRSSLEALDVELSPEESAWLALEDDA